MTDWKTPDDRPRATPERIRLFLDHHGPDSCRHADELLPLMRRDDPTETRIYARDGRLDDGLRMTYRTRAKIHSAPRPPSPYFPPGLSEDVRALSSSLDAAVDQVLCHWSIDLPSGLCYLVFELVEDRRIAGCVKSADQRVVNPDRVPGI